MAQICNGIRNIIYQTVQDQIIGAVCGSFSAFPDNGKAVLFSQPSSRGTGGCSSNFFNGVFFGGQDDTYFVPVDARIQVYITSLIPTLTNNDSEVALGVNAVDGAIVLALAQAIIHTGFLTIFSKGNTEVCLPFWELPQGGGPDVSFGTASCADPIVANASCVCPVYVNVNNGETDCQPFVFKNPLVINTATTFTIEASFDAISDANGACFSALDLSAIVGGGTGCAPTSTTCPASKLSDITGLIQQVNFVMTGMACQSLC